MQTADSSAKMEANGNERAGETAETREPSRVILQVEQERYEESDVIDLAEAVKSIWKKRRFFVYLTILFVCIGFAAAAMSVGLEGVFGNKGCAAAMIEFNFDGIDKGLDPNGGPFDVTRLKSTQVVSAALKELGKENADTEEIRSHLKIEGIMPDSVKQQISVINTVAEKAVEYYTAIEDIDYFPSRYTVSLYRPRGMSGEEARELLDAILAAYRDYFMETYADVSAIGMATQALNIDGYDYMQASDLIRSEIDAMQSYVEAKEKEAPDFRAGSTGLSFGDLASAIRAVRRLDLNNFISFVQANNLTRDAGVQIDYYNYQIREYQYEIQELQAQLSNVEKTIEGYEKDPVIVMSSQESVAETTQTNEYYDTLLGRKLELNRRISELNTELNKTYGLVNSLNATDQSAKEEDYAYADSLLEGLAGTVGGWAELAQKTTEEYFESELYADAYRIAIPAQFSSMGSVGELIKRMAACGGVGAGFSIALWCAAGLRDEIAKSRKKESHENAKTQKR